ncbi:MAG: hypothetical protein Q6M54_07940, partial [Thermostichus sp. DRC_bins_24]
ESGSAHATAHFSPNSSGALIPTFSPQGVGEAGSASRAASGLRGQFVEFLDELLKSIHIGQDILNLLIGTCRSRALLPIRLLSF